MYNRYKGNESLCPICFKSRKISYSFLENYLLNYAFCYECYQSLKPLLGLHIEKNYNLFFQHYYEGLVRETILRFKEQKDIYLGSILFLDLWHLFFKDYIIIPIPSTETANKKRGFKQTQVLCHHFSNEKYNDVIIHTGETEQALTENRSKISNHLILKRTNSIKNKKVLIVDDICTSGHTIESAVNLIQPYARKINVLVLALSKHYKPSSKRFHLPF